MLDSLSSPLVLCSHMLDGHAGHGQTLNATPANSRKKASLLTLTIWGGKPLFLEGICLLTSKYKVFNLPGI